MKLGVCYNETDSFNRWNCEFRLLELSVLPVDTARMGVTPRRMKPKMKLCYGVIGGWKCGLAVIIFVAVSFERRLFLDGILAEHLLYILLFFGQQCAFLAVDAVVVCFSEVGDELAADGVAVLVGHIIQQMLESPCHVLLPGALEVGALKAVGRDAVGVDDVQGGILRGAVCCNQVMQAILVLGTLFVEAVCITVRHCLVIKVFFHSFVGSVNVRNFVQK